MLQTGQVIKSTGSSYIVKNESAEFINCRIKGTFRLIGAKTTNPIAVGDIVNFELEPNKETGVITKLEVRKNYIIRISTNLSKRWHIIASNIDQGVVVVSLKNPKTFTGFIDRYLITAEAYHIPSVIVFNKVDLYED